MVLAEGVFYQTSYDGIELAIIADYPGLLPASHISNQEKSPSKGFPRTASPAALSHATKGRRSTRHAMSGMTPRRAAPVPGKASKRKVGEDKAGPSPKRYGFEGMLWQLYRTIIVMLVLYQEKGSSDYVRGFGRPHSQQTGFRSHRKGGGRYGDNLELSFGRGFGRRVLYQLGSRERHESSALQGCLKRPKVLGRGIQCLQLFGRIHPSCSRWAKKSHKATFDLCAGKFSLSKKDNHMPVAPGTESSWYN